MLIQTSLFDEDGDMAPFRKVNIGDWVSVYLQKQFRSAYVVNINESGSIVVNLMEKGYEHIVVQPDKYALDEEIRVSSFSKEELKELVDQALETHDEVWFYSLTNLM